MATRLPSISLSKYTLLIATQLVVNVLLALWLYNEYLHNPFMQSYVSNVWSSIWPEVVIVAGIGIGATALLTAHYRGHFQAIRSRNDSRVISQADTPGNLAPLDICPFCETPLKTLSEGRLQCRNCRRYFKSSIPRMAA